MHRCLNARCAWGKSGESPALTRNGVDDAFTYHRKPEYPPLRDAWFHLRGLRGASAIAQIPAYWRVYSLASL